jgi:hypothetical protein
LLKNHKPFHLLLGRIAEFCAIQEDRNDRGLVNPDLSGSPNGSAGPDLPKLMKGSICFLNADRGPRQSFRPTDGNTQIHKVADLLDRFPIRLQLNRVTFVEVTLVCTSANSHVH